MNTPKFRDVRVASALRLALQPFEMPYAELAKQARTILAVLGYNEPTNQDVSRSLQYLKARKEAANPKRGYWTLGNRPGSAYHQEWLEGKR